VIPLREQDYIRQRFAAGLKGRVKIDLFTQHRSSLVIPGREDCTHCEDTEKMLREIAALSDSISLTVRQLTEEPDIASKIGIDRVPGIVLRGPANRPVRFFGIPGGNEFPNLIETVIELSDAKAPVSPETIKSLKRLKDTVSVDVYVTPACPYCPAVVRHAYRLAMASGHIRAAAIEIGEFPRLAEEKECACRAAHGAEQTHRHSGRAGRGATRRADPQGSCRLAISRFGSRGEDYGNRCDRAGPTPGTKRTHLAQLVHGSNGSDNTTG
jgi:glutaredoxin-like protein